MTDPAAPAGKDNGLDQLERQAEQHRADFAQTVEELRRRISPKAIKADLRRRTTGIGKGMLAGLEQRALDNPLQAAALGAGVAYPVWRILQNLPAPILLLGAGVALAGRGSNEKAERVRSSNSGQVTSLSEPAQVDEHAGEVTKSNSRAVSTASSYASSTYQAGAEASAEAARKAADAGRATRDSVDETIERYPLVVTGAGLLLGAALAACLPSSRTERQLFGETSDRLKDQARGTVAHALDEVTAAGERIVENTLDEAQEQGLTPSNAQRALRKAGGSARAVADRASGAAFDEEAASPGEKAASNTSSKQDDS
ncbi:DUF3618 domain-containing protein [Devosia sp. RR2S18]|uniref:DUF3618 domain-containing protein n=1 Tax=Devosia rhizosphaerae TaxID=3049774 RepID=UPI00253FB1B7|nr:DUF3618 domain-containing protein [Devosia sp. RR2S18]WIJ24779.1 DUF3618 domain-containing protein [Devosia sp. RR2S18]